MRLKAASLIIVRVNENEMRIDLRTVSEDECGFIVDGLRHSLFEKMTIEKTNIEQLNLD